MPLISIFTPTYNRASKIYRVFNSLKNQTLQDFEWIIVDDGSTDNTKAVIDGFIKENPGFPITYTAQPNSGKHIAINKGLSMATGEWFHIADSDDEIEPQALAVFMKAWHDIPAEKKELFSGVVACCRDQHGKRVSDFVPGGVFDGGFREMYYKYKFRKEAVMINKTEIIRKFPFPENIRNCYFPEAIIWKEMSAQYPVRFINDELRVYYIEDGHSLMSEKIRPPQSKAVSYCIESSNRLNCDMKYFFYSPGIFFRTAIVYHCFLPFLDKDQGKWVFLRPAAKAFAFPFMVIGRIYRRILIARYNNKMRTIKSRVA